jgi:metallo-beta-lactamase family protein
MTVSITFLGAAGTVTGSKYLVQGKSGSLLIDCGMFQGDRTWREKNWHDPEFDLGSINATLITHAHIDHIGLLPRYVTLGLKCPVYASQATSHLARILLLDSGRLQEEEAQYRSERGRSRHHPPLPLYTEADAQAAVGLFKTAPVRRSIEIFPGCSASWSPMGHILGACAITLEIDEKRIVFSGDIGRYNVPILLDPEPLPMGDLLLIESTYGDRLHAPASPADELEGVITRTAKRGGTVIIPSFAVGRTQTLLFYLRELKQHNRIPDIPVIVDSPMANDATSIYLRHTAEYDSESVNLLRKGIQPFTLPKLGFAADRSESMRLNSIDEPMILISASGMLTGGRVLHHLKNRLPDPRNTVLFVGFQPPGSRGAWLKSGAPSCKVLGEEIAVRAEISEISGLSAHADRDELLRWCSSCSGTPGSVAVVHGEPGSAEAFRKTLQDKLSWMGFVAKYRQVYTL